MSRRPVAASVLLLVAILMSAAPAHAIPADDAAFINMLSERDIQVEDIVADVGQAELDCLTLTIPGNDLRTMMIGYVSRGRTLEVASIYTLAAIGAYCPEFWPSREDFIATVGSISGPGG